MKPLMIIINKINSNKKDGVTYELNVAWYETVNAYY